MTRDVKDVEDALTECDTIHKWSRSRAEFRFYATGKDLVCGTKWSGLIGDAFRNFGAYDSQEVLDRRNQGFRICPRCWPDL